MKPTESKISKRPYSNTRSVAGKKPRERTKVERRKIQGKKAAEKVPVVWADPSPGPVPEKPEPHSQTQKNST